MKTVGEWLRGNEHTQPDKEKGSQQNRSPQSHPQTGRSGDDSSKRRPSHRRPNNRGGNRPAHPPAGRAGSGSGKPPQHRPPGQPQPKYIAPVLQGGAKSGLRIYPLGGFEQVGRNCMVIEVDGDIYIVDLGLQFPDEDMLGIDYLIPDVSCLRGRENRIRGVLFTHGHLDHIGAVQHLMPQLHFPKCFGTKLTIAMARKRLDEEKLTSKCSLNPVEYGEKIRLGKVEVEFLKVTHSIPDSAAIALHTPYGTIVHTGDFKFDLTPVNEDPADFQRLAELGKNGVLAIIADSTNASVPGFSKSETDISKTLHDLVRDAEGRIIVSTFSSLLTRIQQIIDHAKIYNRKIFISGRSMVTNIEIAQNLGYIKAPRGMIRKVGPGMEKIPDKEVIIITTGSQGEARAGLARIGLGTHRQIAVKKGDTVILSSNPIIGNQRAVTKVINNLQLKGAIIKTNAELSLHTTGHGNQGDIQLMHRLVKAKHVIPEHGEPYMRSAHADIARSVGYEDNQIHMLINGEILEFDTNGNARKSKQKHTVNDVIIDGREEAASEGKRVMSDRKIMSEGGMVSIVFRAYKDSGRLIGTPDVISRGLLYGSEEAEISGEVAQVAKKAYEESLNRGEKDRSAFKKAVTGALYRYFDRKLSREPMIVPVIVEV
ncbi:MAG: RNase J family beta-CASP ribonuclease [bacterium]|nr:RNase J family beta-CASP ribonuclease [bacterium]